MEQGKKRSEPELKAEIVVLLDEIRRERDPKKFRQEQFPRLKGLVEELRDSKKR